MNFADFWFLGIRYILSVVLFACVLFACDDDDEKLPAIAEVTAINPQSALPNAMVAITGKAFSPVFSENKVTFNGKEALVANASSTQLNVVVPADAKSGPVVVTVSGNAATNQPLFTVESPPTLITNITPASGGYNTKVTITGANFLSPPTVNVVTFNGVAGTVTAGTATSLTVSVPARSGSGVVLVNGVAAGVRFNYIPDVFVAGYVYDTFGKARATYWKNGVPTTLAGPGQHTFANEIAIVNDDVYVVGYRHNGTFAMARLWKNGAEIPLSDDARTSFAAGICLAGNDVYIAGYEHNSAGKSIARYWKNGNPVDISTNATLSDIAVYGQDVYVVGYSPDASGRTVATYWKNQTPIQLTGGLSYVTSIFVSGNDVYTTGAIRNTGPGIDFVSYWKNSRPVLLGPGLAGGAASDIVVVGDDVYVAGTENNIADIGVAKYWKNGNPVVLSDAASSGTAYAIDVIGEDVYVAGSEEARPGVAVAKYWKNGLPLAITDGGYNAIATSIVVR